MRNEALWTLTTAEAAAYFDAFQTKGDRVVSYSLYGTRAEPRHAIVWRKAARRLNDAAQRIVLPLNQWAFRREVEQQAEEGYFAAYVGGFGIHGGFGVHQDEMLGGIFEKLPAGTTPPQIDGQPAPAIGTFVTPRWWSGNGGPSFTAAVSHTNFYIRSVGFMGSPTKRDFRDAGQYVDTEEVRGLRFFATLWPKSDVGFNSAVGDSALEERLPR